MTKEIILNNCLLAIGDYNINKNVGERWAQFNQEQSTIAIYRSMDEYAAQQAAAFIEWAIDNEKVEPWGLESSSVRIVPKETAQSIYNQFIEQQNKP